MLQNYRVEFGLAQKRYCTEPENREYQSMVRYGRELPPGVYPCMDEYGSFSTTKFYTVVEEELTEKEKEEYLTYRTMKLQEEANRRLETIKNCMVFFTTLAVIGLVVGVCAFLGVVANF